MRKIESKSINSQLQLPFQATRDIYLKQIFNVLRKYFNLEINTNQKLIDLGSGDGSIILYSVLNYKIISVGVEINKGLINETRGKIKELKEGKKYNSKDLRKIKLKNEDLFEQDLKNYDFIYIYSLPTMQKFLKHVFNTAKKGAIIISYKYSLTEYDSFLKLVHKLNLEEDQEKISVYYYRKFI